MPHILWLWVAEYEPEHCTLYMLTSAPLYTQWEEADIKLVDADLLELVLVRGQLPALRETVLYPALCSQLEHPGTTPPPNTLLFARLLQCPHGEVGGRLQWESPGAKVKKTVGQLYSVGMTVEAGSLVLSSQGFHPGLRTVNTAMDSLGQILH